MNGAPEFVLGINPVVSWTGPEYEHSVGALVAYLQDRLGRPVRLGIESDYSAQIAKMREGSLDATFFGAYAFYRAREEASAVALVTRVQKGSNTPGTYQSVVVVRSDGALRSLRDLRGGRVGFVDPNSTAGYLIPMRMLREAGLNPDADISYTFFHTHQAVLEAVQAGDVSAGAVHRRLYADLVERDAGAAAALRSIATSPPMPAGPVAVRHDLDWETRQRLLLALLRLHEDPDAARLLLPPGDCFRPASTRSVTLKTVAALADTSYGTVSRVINGAAHVAPETHARVMTVIQELGYRPNATARNLAANRSGLVGVLVPDAADPSVAGCLEGVQRALSPYGIQAVLCVTGGDRGREACYLDLLETGAFGGLLLMAWSLDTPGVGLLDAAGHAVVMLGVAPGSSSLAAVAPDAVAAWQQAIDHVNSLGHQNVGALVPAALMDAIEGGHGSAVAQSEPQWYVTVDDVAAARAAAATLLDSPDRPTALICGTERIAYGVLQAAHALHVDVPAALSVLALGESWLAEASTPPLTTVGSALDMLGERAALILLNRMNGDEMQLTVLALAPPLLVERGSTARYTAVPERSVDLHCADGG